MSAAEDSFKVGDQQFNAGSFIIKTKATLRICDSDWRRR